MTSSAGPSAPPESQALASKAEALNALADLHYLYVTAAALHGGKYLESEDPDEIATWKREYREYYRRFDARVDDARVRLLAVETDVPDDWLTVRVCGAVSCGCRLDAKGCPECHFAHVESADIAGLNAVVEQIGVRLLRRRASPPAEAATPPQGTDPAAETKRREGRKTNRGRKRLSKGEERRRKDILAAWDKAWSNGLTMKDFCRDCQSPLTVKELERFVAWKAARNRRKREN